jgi:hypothetical protein
MALAFSLLWLLQLLFLPFSALCWDLCPCQSSCHVPNVFGVTSSISELEIQATVPSGLEGEVPVENRLETWCALWEDGTLCPSHFRSFLKKEVSVRQPR